MKTRSPASPSGKNGTGWPKPACFHLAKDCTGVAAVEKQGKTLCRVCADTVRGQEFPLRQPTYAPLYWSVLDLCRALGMRRVGRAESRPATLNISMIEAS